MWSIDGSCAGLGNPLCQRLLLNRRRADGRGRTLMSVVRLARSAMPGDLVLREDDWRQFEVVSRAFTPLVDAAVADI
jgi:hypothetical protein